MDDFRKNLKIIAKKIFSCSDVSIKNLDANEVGILFNNNGFVIEKTKNENSIKIFLRKGNPPDLLFRSFILVYGNSIEKNYFEKSYNKLYFDSEKELQGILNFLKNKYDTSLKAFFSDNLMSIEIEKYFTEQRENTKGKTFTIQETQTLIAESMAFAKKIRFTQEGNIYLKD